MSYTSYIFKFTLRMELFSYHNFKKIHQVSEGETFHLGHFSDGFCFIELLELSNLQVLLSQSLSLFESMLTEHSLIKHALDPLQWLWLNLHEVFCAELL